MACNFSCFLARPYITHVYLSPTGVTLSCAGVATDGIWIDNCIKWTLLHKARDYTLHFTITLTFQYA
jgi:hypothetical protein